MQLQAENLKYSQTFPALIKEADKIKKNINNLKRTNQQQAELIRLRESEEQVLVSQVVSSLLFIYIYISILILIYLSIDKCMLILFI